MLPDPLVVERRILDLPDEEARAAGEAAVATADYWGAIAQAYQYDACEPIDAPLVVEVTQPPAFAPAPRPRNLVPEWVAQQQARTASPILLALQQLDGTLRAVIAGVRQWLRPSA